MTFLAEPTAIEARSLATVARALEEEDRPREEKQVLARMLHASGDLGLKEVFDCHPDFVARALAGLRTGANVVVDVKMVAAGIDRRRLRQLGGRVHCAIARAEVVARARAQGLTRAMAAMDYLAPLMQGGLVAIGNAPTALFRLLQLWQEGRARPAAVVGTPVGFVGAAEAKEALRESGIPYLTVRGSRGGSTVAAAAVNALLRLAVGKAD
ncbi:MAG: precorrin-8X methylmutase [Clostridia bacterium]|nr:precorrin-8X methylmutase [Clostridia bacterium]MDH7573556.1 precorrin-8X methylmutase [Clostridia bacterium]